MIVGVGDSDLLLLGIKPLTKKKKILLMSENSQKLKEFLESVEDKEKVSLLYGKASDLEVWRKVNLSETQTVVMHLEARRCLDAVQILRNVLSYAGQILAVLDEPSELEKLLYELEVEVLKPYEFLSGRLEAVVEGRGVYRRLECFGKGEAVEVLVEEFSPLAGMRLREVRQRDFRIALVMRNAEAVLPKGELRLEVGDRLLVVGRPQKVENFIHSLVIGDYRFPLEWGDKVLVCGDGKEVKYIKGILGTGRFEKTRCSEIDSLDGSVGAVIFNKKRESFFGKNYIKLAFERLSVPSFFMQGSHPYRKVLLFLGEDVEEFTLVKSVSLLRFLSNSRADAILAVKPEISAGDRERERIEEVKALVDRINGIYSLALNLMVKEGNPVRETLKLVKDYNLLIVGYQVGRRSSFFSPYSPYLVASKSPITTLLLPEVDD